MWAQLLGAAKAVGPKAAKTLVQVWPLINDAKTREQVVKLLAPITDRHRSSSRESRLAAVRSVVETASAKASAPEQKEKADGWERRADALGMSLLLLDLGHRSARRQRRADWDAKLDKLVADIIKAQSDWSDDEKAEAPGEA
jgi:hypothetical protein